MGSFRSEPELTKSTQTGTFDRINFAVSHMCGIPCIISRMENLYVRCTYQCGSLY